MKQRLQKRRWYRAGAAVPAAIVVTAFAALGFALLRNSGAATHGVADQAENALLTGNAAKITEINASGGNAVRFGRNASAPTVPSNLVTFTGGNSIALRWDPSSAAGTAVIKHYDIYRNNTKIASITPEFRASFPEFNGTGYLDVTVTSGQSYNYQVVAVDTTNLESGRSTAVTTTQPAANTYIVPTVTVDATATPNLASFMNNSLVPFVSSWYPKIADYYDGGGLTTRVRQIKLVGEPTATFTSWSMNGTTLTIMVAASNFATAEEQKDLGGISQAISEAAVLGPLMLPEWVRTGIRMFPYEHMVRGKAPTQLSGLSTFGHGYTPAAALLEYVRTKHRPTIVTDIAQASLKGTFSPTLFFETTGKTPEMLWAAMSSRTMSPVGLISNRGKCLTGSYTHNATVALSLQTCFGTETQAWRFDNDQENKYARMNFGNYGCAHPHNGGTSDGTLVMAHDCSVSRQNAVFQVNTNGTITQASSGKCLHVKGGAAVENAQIELRTCNGSAEQAWTVSGNTTPRTPAGLRAVTGGADIALTWNVTPDQPSMAAFDIYRNGVKIGNSRQSWQKGGEQFATIFYDRNVTPGTTYSYQVQAINTNGTVSPLSTAVSITHSSAGIAVPTVTLDPSLNTHIPELVPWFQNVGSELLKTWYPKIANVHVGNTYTPPNNIIIKTLPPEDFKLNASAYVDFQTNIMTFNPNAAQSYVNRGAALSSTTVHESVHILQFNPPQHTTYSSWFTEGGADHGAEFMYRATPNLNNTTVSHSAPSPKVLKPSSHYALDHYEIAGHLIQHIDSTYNPNFSRIMTQANRTNTTTPAMLQMSDGKNLDQVYTALTGNTFKTGALRGPTSGKCIESRPEEGVTTKAYMQLKDCNGRMEQRITIVPKDDGTVALIGSSRCVGLNSNSGPNQAAAFLENCIRPSTTTNRDQSWILNSNGTISNAAAPNRCLEPFNAGTANGTYLQIFDCNGASWQRWTLP